MVRLEKAVLAAVILDPSPGRPMRAGDVELTELRELARAAGANVVDQIIQHRGRPDSGMFMGKGKIDELAVLVQTHGATVVIFENDLSPSQIRNIEEVVKCRVIDRSELILDIFASRARTFEAKLQVELAQLEYTYPRLTGMWTHLERTGGGIGTRGPGETQLETDRRIVQRRKSELRAELERVQSRKQREVHKRNTDFYTVGLVGYTNAGKSTLFNTLTDAGVYATDLLFATLDTRTRRWDLGGGDSVMLSDTVGFVRDLPHHLVASFRATLEESVNSDLLLIVLDVSDPAAQSHYDTVQEVLDEIETGDQPRLILLNKIDRLEDQSEIIHWQQMHPEALAISAGQGLGLDQLVETVRRSMRGSMIEATIRLSMADGKSLNFLENRATVLDRQYEDSAVMMRLRIGTRQLDQLRSTGAQFEIVDQQPAG
jgi:GTP-binding protein HflX